MTIKFCHFSLEKCGLNALFLSLQGSNCVITMHPVSIESTFLLFLPT